MKALTDILKKIEIVEIIGKENISIAAVTFDSRKCAKNGLFVAVRGTQTDGHKFIKNSIEKGSVAVICETLPENIQTGITYIKVANSARALGLASAAFFNHPSTELKLVGVTGTNGKTTIASLLFALARKLGYKAGLLSTIENRIEDTGIGATHTTPDPVQINELLQKMVDRGCTYCFMEVSSHAIDQERIAGLQFLGGIFTNLTHDHLDYHKTFDAYLAAKKKFFDELPETSFALTNLDDKNGRVMLQNTKAQKHSYALKSPADYKGKIIENHFNGLQMNINGREVWCSLVGRFNAYNILAAVGAATLCGEDYDEALTAMSSLDIVEGRFDYLVSSDNITGIVDYAHTPDALQNVLDTITDIRTNNENLITVVGAGGNRDQSKRGPMGKIAARLSNKVIITSDNPRNEEPEAIITQILKGVEPENTGKVLSITSRKEAIKTACMLAQPGDIILVAGKGHEKYQEIKGERQPFDDKQLLTKYLSVTETLRKQN